MRQFLRRLSVVPFEIALAIIAVYAGTAGLIGFSRSSDALALLIPAWAVFAFQTAYITSGVCIVYGAGRGRAAAEVFGLFILGSSLVVRAVAMFWFLGWDQVAISAVAPNAAFLGACIVRWRVLARGVTLIRAESV